MAARGDGVEEMAHEHDVHHRDFVEDDDVRLELLVLVLRKHRLRGGRQDIDYVLTTRELIKYVGLTFHDLPETPFDRPLGEATGGGGQPLGTTRAITKERIASLYAIDHSLPHRKSHENPVIQKLYERDLGAPLSPKAHDLLHTTYHEIPPACTF